MEAYALSGFIFFAAIFYFIYRAYSNTARVEFNQVRLPDATGASPAMKVLHISDLHMENISVAPSRLFAMLSGEKPDLIALTGDFLDREPSIPKLASYLDVFRKLNPKYGIYAVFGNHDYVLKNESFSRLYDVLEEYGCKVLQNENECLLVDGRRIHIIGVDDCSTGRSDLVQAFDGVEDGYRLVLTHDPNVVLNMGLYPFHYLLAGHFHGGQIYWPKPYHLTKMGKLAGMNMLQGLHNYDGKPFYISTGLGQTGLNIRVGCRPEITMHHLPLHTPINELEKTPKAV